MKPFQSLKKMNYEELLLYSLLAIVILTTLLFLTIYMIWVPFLPARLAHLIYLAFNLSLIKALNNKRYIYVKVSILIANILQLAVATFLWFPLTTNYELFYFLLPMGAFAIMDVTKLKERIFAFTLSLTALFLFFLNRFWSINYYMFEIGQIPARIISFFTITSTMTILILYFYLHAYFLDQKRLELEYLANTDSLTDINNRRSFYSQGKLEFDLAYKYDHTFSLLLLDIDHFKIINDTYGHDAGDEVLKQISMVINENIREQDTFARHGGEEFTLLLRNTNQQTGLAIAEKLRQLIENLEINTDGQTLKVTISIGVVQYSSKLSEFDMLISLADKALYDAKNQGRNRSVFRA